MKRVFVFACALALSIGSVSAAAAARQSEKSAKLALFKQVIELINDEAMDTKSIDAANKILCENRELATMADENGWFLFDHANKAGNWQVAECILNLSGLNESQGSDVKAGEVLEV
ncbi:hypothetical protein K2X40_00140 [Candidatus Babeliales bacterium]|nr:hypothetical protein [Candidatus Babeliales bacterium]